MEKAFTPGSSSTGKLGQETLGWGHVCLGPTAAPALTYSQEAAADMWSDGK